VHDIPGLVTCDFVGVDELMDRARAATAASYDHGQVYGEWIHIGQHIACAPDDAFDYASDVFSLEEWTTSLRDFQPVGDGLHRGVDGFGGTTAVYARVEAHRASGTVDYHCAWDQGAELWLRNHLRFIDARPTMGRDGTLMTWSIHRHPYFRGDGERVPGHIRTSMRRPGRPWIGEAWPYFPAIHGIEARNLKTILERRAPLDPHGA
jgi:hypothetical protein